MGFPTEIPVSNKKKRLQKEQEQQMNQKHSGPNLVAPLLFGAGMGFVVGGLGGFMGGLFMAPSNKFKTAVRFGLQGGGSFAVIFAFGGIIQSFARG